MLFKWIIFDADGTLFDYDAAELHALINTFTQFGFTFRDEFLQIYRQFNKNLWLDFEEGTISIPKLKVLRFKQLLEALKLEANPSDFSDTYLEQLAYRHDLIEGADVLLASLYGSVGLMLMTNGIKEVQRSRLKLSSIGDYFSHIIISDEVGVAKPDKMLFEIAMQDIRDSNKEAVLMVGDNLSSDIKGGYDFGIPTCWYNPQGKENDQDITPTYQISDLQQILAIVRGEIQADDRPLTI